MAASPDTKSSLAEIQECVEKAERINDQLMVFLREVEACEAQLVRFHSSRSGVPVMVSLRADIKTEMAAMEKIRQQVLDGNVRGTRHRLASSNARGMINKWDYIKRFRHLTAYHRRFRSFTVCDKRDRKKPWPPGINTMRELCNLEDSDKVLVDAVVDGGARWIRVLSADKRRLLFQMAEAGFLETDSDDESGGEGQGHDVHKTKGDEVEVLRQARLLCSASRNHWHNYRHPAIHLILCNVTEGEVKEIDALISQLRSLGRDGVQVRVDTSTGELCTAPGPPTDEAVTNLADVFCDFTPTLSIDTSALIGLASDISNSRTEEPADSTRHDVIVQIKEEDARPGCFLDLMFSALRRGKRLICHRVVASFALDLARTIGTENEIKRLDLLLGQGADNVSKSRQELIEALRPLTLYPVPDDLMLPISIVDDGIQLEKLPSFAEPVMKDVFDPNRSGFLYGWTHDITTVSCNLTLAKSLERRILRERAPGSDEAGPRLWISDINRAFFCRRRRRQFIS